jgi:hypothetical protein
MPVGFSSTARTLVGDWFQADLGQRDVLARAVSLVFFVVFTFCPKRREKRSRGPLGPDWYTKLRGHLLQETQILCASFDPHHEKYLGSALVDFTCFGMNGRAREAHKENVRYSTK